MSKKKKSEIDDLPNTESRSPEVEAPVKPKIPFAVWFDKMVKSGKIRDYQEEALLVFFRKKGLKSSEDANTYTRAFENF